LWVTILIRRSVIRWRCDCAGGLRRRGKSVMVNHPGRKSRTCCRPRGNKRRLEADHGVAVL
jgi:hypothetical protein